MAYEIQGKQHAPLPVYPAPNAPAPIATVTTVARVFVISLSPGWVQVRLLEGAAAGTVGWAQAAHVTSVTGDILSSEEELSQLFAALRTAHFTPPMGGPLPIPYRYPTDGCFARAEIMATMLAASGYQTDKIFAVAAGNGLRLNTPHGGDQAGFGERLQVEWWYHVAPLLYVPSGSPKPDPVVMDPSVADGPLSIGDWVGRMATRPVAPEIAYDQLRQDLAVSKAYPTDRTLVVRAGRTVYAPPLATDPSRTVVGKPADVALELSRTATLVPAHDVVAGLDQLFRACFTTWSSNQTTRDLPVPYPAYTAEYNAVLAQIQNLHPELRKYIRTRFPNFFADWHNTVLGSGVENDYNNLKIALAV
ncbi:protein-glutamine glutaminase family protein [Sphaerisporangium aureirubrum]|uniref:Protein-glutamine glutaminase family protein n=1 Tax=Sphaerisporangium aureirubrum TaxID=1544736 RepID=A0ABW1NB10_9ACTN